MNQTRRRVWWMAAVLAVIVSFTMINAQERPKPGPEHQRLGFFVGKWSSEGEINENPLGMPSGKFSGKDSCDWFEGKFSVVCHSEGDGPMGASKGIGIMSYSPMDGVYTYYGTDSIGMTMTTIPLGKVDGKTWVYDDEAEMGGITLKNRYTIVETSDSSYTFKWEIEGEGGEWMTVMHGRNTKG